MNVFNVCRRAFTIVEKLTDGFYPSWCQEVVVVLDVCGVDVFLKLQGTVTEKMSDCCLDGLKLGVITTPLFLHFLNLMIILSLNFSGVAK